MNYYFCFICFSLVPKSWNWPGNRGWTQRSEETSSVWLWPAKITWMHLRNCSGLFFITSVDRKKETGRCLLLKMLRDADVLMPFICSAWRMGLKDTQEREIVHVLMDCCLQEKTFNAYYAVLGEKFCSHDRRFQVKHNGQCHTHRPTMKFTRAVSSLSITCLK